jgi:hypothetical protein
MSNQTNNIDKQIKLISQVAVIPVIICGVGLYAKYVPNAKELHPLLANTEVVNLMILIGGFVALSDLLMIVFLKKRANRVKSKSTVTREN